MPSATLPRCCPRIPRRAQGGAAEGGHYAGCKSAAHLSHTVRPTARLHATLIDPMPLRRPRTDIRPPFGTLNANSATMQPLSNSDTDATNRHSTISQTIQQPLSNPAPTIGNLNPSTTVLQPPDGRFRAWQTPTTQPSFVSSTRTTRFRLNLPTSLISQLQPILINNSTSTTPRPLPNHYSTTRKARQNCRADTVPLPLRQGGGGRKLLILFSSALHHICAKAEHGRNFRRLRRASCAYRPQVL